MERSRIEHLVLQLPKEGILAVLVHGSQVDDTAHAFSDVDLCIVAPGLTAGHKRKLLHSLSSNAGVDAHFFEDLPLMIKKDIMSKNRPVFVSSSQALVEYFLFWQKVYESFVPTYLHAKQHATERMSLWKSKKRSRKSTIS